MYNFLFNWKQLKFFCYQKKIPVGNDTVFWNESILIAMYVLILVIDHRIHRGMMFVKGDTFCLYTYTDMYSSSKAVRDLIDI